MLENKIQKQIYVNIIIYKTIKYQDLEQTMITRAPKITGILDVTKPVYL